MGIEDIALFNLGKKYDMQRRGLRIALKSLDGEIGESWPNIVPDAYQICDFTLTVFEIEDTNPLTRKKLSQYSRFAFDVDSAYGCWLIEDFNLIITDRYGLNEIHLTNEDLISLEYNFIANREC